MIQLRPNQGDLERLKEPFGKLILGDPPKTMPELNSIISRLHPRKVVAVGDVVSRETYAAGIRVDLRIMKDDDAVILVDGEEDLLALPCIVESPNNSLVLYGQPSQGLVVVDTSSTVRNEASLILSRMTREETSRT